MKKLIAALATFALCLVLAGCQPIENSARDTSAALSGSIVAAQSQYGTSCVANPSQSVCQTINKAISGENALVTAVEAYCGWSPTLAPPDPTAKCVPVKSAQAALQSAISDAAALTLEIKGAL